MKFLCISLTILFTVLGQMVLKLGERTLYWPKSFSFGEFARLIWYSMTNVYVMGSLFLTLGAAIMWLLVVQLMPLGRAYPFMSLNYVFIYLLSIIFFGERLSCYSALGVLCIIIGTMLLGYGLVRS